MTIALECLEEFILKRLREYGHHSFSDLLAVARVDGLLPGSTGKHDYTADRTLDRSLQRLRKRGAIESVNRKWGWAPGAAT